MNINKLKDKQKWNKYEYVTDKEFRQIKIKRKHLKKFQKHSKTFYLEKRKICELEKKNKKN